MVMSSLFLGKDFGSNIIGSAAERSPSAVLPVLASHQECSKSEVANFDIHVLIQEYVSHLEISMNDASGMHILDSSCNLDRPKPHLGLRNIFPLLDHIHQGTIRAEFEHNICAFVV